MARIQYRRLTPDEQQYLIQRYCDDPQVINAMLTAVCSSTMLRKRATKAIAS